MPSLTFSKAVQWAGLQSLLGRFWPLGLGFDTLGLRESISLFNFPKLSMYESMSV